MKKRYKRLAYYLDDDLLLCGYKDKRGFHPQYGLNCGFGLQIVSKKEIGKTLFFSLSDAIEKLGEITLCGGSFLIAIDDGMATTKIIGKIDNNRKYYTSNTIVTKDNIENIIKEYFNSIGIKDTYDVEIRYCLSSETIKTKNNITHKIKI